MNDVEVYRYLIFCENIYPKKRIIALAKMFSYFNLKEDCKNLKNK